MARDRQTHQLFAELRKAFDIVPVCKLWIVLENTAINCGFTTILP